MKLLPLLSLTAAFFLASAVSSHATLITFVGNDGTAYTSYTESGYTFSAAHFHVFDQGVAAGSLTAALDFDDPGLLTLQAAGAAPFDLISLSLGEDQYRYYDTTYGAKSVNLIGHLNGGGTVTASLTFDNVTGYQTLSLPTFTNLSSVTFEGVGATNGDVQYSNALSLDNVNVQAYVPTSVPEPTTALFGMAMVGVCAASRRRTASKA